MGTPQEGYISLAYTDLLQSELGDMQASWVIPACEQQAPARSLFTERRAMDTPDDSPANQNYGPDHGRIEAVEDEGDVSRVTFRFSLTQRQIDNLRSLGGDHLEIDFALRGYNFPAGTGVVGQNGWDNYRILSNLPGAAKDVAFWDKSRLDQNPAATGIDARLLQAGQEYFATLLWRAQELQKVDRPQVSVGWTSSHWAHWWNAIESNSCDSAGAYSENRAAWCVFPNTHGWLGGSREYAYRLIEATGVYPEYAGGFVPLGADGRVSVYAF